MSTKSPEPPATGEPATVGDAAPRGAAARAEPELPPTPLAALAERARQRLGPEPDRAGPAATKAMAAIVRDLKGMPDLVVSREHATRIRIHRRGKVGAVGLEYLPSIRAVEVTHIGFPDPEPGAPRGHRYTFRVSPDEPADAGHLGGAWQRLDEGGELFDDVKEALLRLYPELGPSP
jgi:hypothetical protein